MKPKTGKTLAFVLIVAAMAMFTVAIMVWAGETIQGKYAITGSGNCFLAINGFNALLQPNDGTCLAYGHA
jgi:hypothetical protein